MNLVKILKKLKKTHMRKKDNRYIEKIRGRGGEIGYGCRFWDAKTISIDTQRPNMLHIGNYVKITRNVTILAHDYSRSVVAMCMHENVGEARQTWIGDNVFIGMNSTVLMGSYIGNNSIVGAGSVVSRSFPDGVVICGNPAKVICTIEEYYEKRKQKTVDEAVGYAISYHRKYNRYPTVYEMTDAFAWLYLPRTPESIEKYHSLFQVGGVDQEQYTIDFLNSEPFFESFEKFLEYVVEQQDVTQEKENH